MNGNFSFDSIISLPNLNLQSSSSRAQAHDQPPPFDHHDDGNGTMMGASTGDHSGASVLVMKKLNHRASERDRREKINSLYFNLRSLLPCNYYDPTKHLGIPTIVGGALKYIPELQKKVKDLNHTKQDLISKVGLLHRCVDESIDHDNKKRKRKGKEIEKNSRYSISINKLDEREIIIHISTSERIPLPEVLLQLEKNGFLILGVSSSKSFEGKAFYNIHLLLQEERSFVMEEEVLNEQLESLIEKHRQVYLYF